jgi:hypothetical protein
MSIDVAGGSPKDAEERIAPATKVPLWRFKLAQSKRMPPAKSRAKDGLFCLESAGFRERRR